MLAARLGRSLLAFSLTFTLFLSAAPVSAVGAGGEFVPRELLIQFRPGATAAQRADAMRSIGATRKELVRSGLELAVLPAGRTVADAARKVNAHGAVAFAEPNWIYTHGATSNDPLYTDGSLWGMYGDSTAPANKYGSQAGEAWAAGNTGDASVHVGIIDEGIDISHPDLKNNIWVNPYDPVDGIDNDGNGYVDDKNGWDFVNNDNSVYDGKGPRDTSTDAHGTHVAGTIGGVGGNGFGVAGVNWNVKLISAKFLGKSGGTTANAIKAVDYITGLKTLHPGMTIPATNNSWGGGGFSQGLFDAIERANAAGILFVAAAGNGGSDGVGDNNDTTPHFPSSYANSNVIAVAAIDKTGKMAAFSNFGLTTVDLAAPGVAVFSTTPKNTYKSFSGTSMATPHVTGGAALYASTHIGASDEAIKAAILGSTVPTPSLSGKCVTEGRLDVSGY